MPHKSKADDSGSPGIKTVYYLLSHVKSCGSSTFMQARLLGLLEGVSGASAAKAKVEALVPLLPDILPLATGGDELDLELVRLVVEAFDASLADEKDDIWQGYLEVLDMTIRTGECSSHFSSDFCPQRLRQARLKRSCQTTFGTGSSPSWARSVKFNSSPNYLSSVLLLFTRDMPQ